MMIAFDLHPSTFFLFLIVDGQKMAHEQNCRIGEFSLFMQLLFRLFSLTYSHTDSYQLYGDENIFLISQRRILNERVQWQ